MAMHPQYHHRIYEAHIENPYDAITDVRVNIRAGIYLGSTGAAVPGYAAYVGAYATNIQRAATTAGWLTGLTTNLYGELVLAGYTWATQSLRTEEINPLSTQHNEDTLFSASHADESVTSYYFDMDNFRFFSLQFILSGALGVGITLAETLQDDGTAPATCTYVDRTLSWAGATPITANGVVEKDTPTACKYVRVTVDNTNGSGAITVTCYLKRMY